MKPLPSLVVAVALVSWAASPAFGADGVAPPPPAPPSAAAVVGLSSADPGVGAVPAAGSRCEHWTAQFRDPDDGAFDMSRWLASRTGFLPIAIPITEPALGYGVAAGALFFHKRDEEDAERGSGRRVPPSVSTVVGGVTSNGTWVGGLGHLGIWKDDAIRYTGGIGYGEVHLDFYGISGALADTPRPFITEGLFVLQSLSFRLGCSDFFLGARYRFLDMDTTFPDGLLGLGIEERTLDSRTAGAAITGGYDSRDNIFTPNRGVKAELSLWAYRPFLGGEFEYEKAEAYAFGYVPLGCKVVLGLRVEAKSTRGDVPFYDLPYVTLRGVPTFRYVGEHVLTTEAEVRWDVTERWSLVGFAGYGAVAFELRDLPGEFGQFDFRQDVVSGGVGFRYLLAKALGIRVGLDLAWSDDEGSIYVTVGSAWLRP